MNSADAKLNRNTPKSLFIEAFCLLLCFIASTVTVHYLKLQPEPPFQIALFIGTYLASRRLKSYGDLTRTERIAQLAYSFVLSIAVVLGFHITITGKLYIGLSNENYISPYGFSDIIALVCIIFCFYRIFAALFSLAKERNLTRTPSDSTRTIVQPSWKTVIICGCALFLMYLPYLLVYFPGFIFGDSISSLQQIATGSYSNHHPFFYTMLIKACLDFGTLIGAGATGGCAIYSIIQMALVSACFSYMINWIVIRSGLKTWHRIALIIVFGLSPYICTYSIAMWKDPLFSCAVVIASLQLTDYSLSSGKVASSKLWVVSFGLMLVLIGLLRSNGIAILALLLVAFLFINIADNKHALNIVNRKKVTSFVAASLLACLLITGPIYGMLGVAKAPRAESVGVPLSQMARTVALGGAMSDSDHEYMGTILPIGDYVNLYKPTCIDTLKWNDSFNGAALDDPSFFAHWASMLVRNPGIYFEAWELQTFGFWAINSTEVNTFAVNIISGVPRNLYEEYSYELDDLGITCENLLVLDRFRSIFPADQWSIPLSIIHWFIFWLAMLILLLRRPLNGLGLIPTLGLIASVVLASPIWYWPRYGAAEHFLIPLYIYLLYVTITQTSHQKSTLG